MNVDRIHTAIDSIELSLEEKQAALEESKCPKCGKPDYTSTEIALADTRAKAIRDALEWAVGEEDSLHIGTLERVLNEHGERK